MVHLKDIARLVGDSAGQQNDIECGDTFTIM